MFWDAMSSIYCLSNGESRSICMENPKGEKGKGGMAAGILGPGRKGSSAIRGVKAGETYTIAEMDGPGVINHIWMTVPEKTDHDFFVLSDIVLRMYWDDEDEPSVECPVGDFYCNGFGTYTPINSFPITVNPVRGYNCYFPMPFRKKARITIENQHAADVRCFFYQIDYTLYDSLPDNTGYFHAQWRRERQTRIGQDYTILDGVKGKGQYVGTYIAHTALERYWYGEGEVKIYLDGDKDYPTICGTGMEDYFGGGFGFVVDQRKETPAVETLYQTPFQGFCYYSAREENYSWRFEGACPPMRGFYRWHIMDPIHFKSDFRMTIQQIGTCHKGLFERSDDLASVAYWYQTEPHAPFPVLPSREYRWPR